MKRGDGFLIIGYLGPAGTFTEAAAKEAFSQVEEEVDYRPLPTIVDVLDAVNEQVVDAGVVPIENSIQGTVLPTFDGLLERNSLQMAHEVVLPIEQHLLTVSPLDIGDIREVWSHPQALAQCAKFIHNLGATEIVYASTAAAAVALSESARRDVAVIGSVHAAQGAHLHIQQHNVADYPGNWTRFAVVQRGLDGKTFSASTLCKTMLGVVPFNDNPGVLASILQVFATLGLNLCFIESRPTKTRLGMYHFLLEIQASTEEEDMQTAIRVLGAYGHDVRVLGCYLRQTAERDRLS